MTSVPPAFEVVAFFAADHAEAFNGKVYINGGFWNRLNFPQYPAVVPNLALVAVVMVPFHEYHRDHRVTVGMVDADGQTLPMKIEGQFRVGASPDLRPGDPTTMPLAFVVNGLKIDRAGDYSFTLEIDEQEVERYQIRAMQIATPMRFKLNDQD